MLLSESGIVKVGDFGLAKQLEQTYSMKNTSSGTLMYMAPEMYNGGACLKSDVWSLGISVYEMAEGKNPLAGCSHQCEIMYKVCMEKGISLPLHWSPELRDFVSKCLVKDVNERSSAVELLKVGVSQYCND